MGGSPNGRKSLWNNGESERPCQRPACGSEAVAGPGKGPVKTELSCPSAFARDRRDRGVVSAGERGLWLGSKGPAAALGFPHALPWSEPPAFTGL